MVNLELECRLATQRQEELRNQAARMRRLQAARPPRAVERPSRVVQLRRVPDVRSERS
jgi:hypothetical protein